MKTKLFRILTYVFCFCVTAAYAGEEAEIISGSDFPFYIKEAEAGDAEAMRRAAVCYQTGAGVEKDLRNGKAAAEGNTEAQYDIGTLYRDAIGTEQNYREAAYWFRKAASNGHSKAMINIARQFAEGKGVLQDYRIAAENYWRAAERGEEEGAYQFAVMLRDGIGVKKDLTRALKYFRQAAKSDYKDSALQARRLESDGIRGNDRKH